MQETDGPAPRHTHTPPSTPAAVRPGPLKARVGRGLPVTPGPDQGAWPPPWAGLRGHPCGERARVAFAQPRGPFLPATQHLHSAPQARGLHYMETR